MENLELEYNNYDGSIEYNVLSQYSKGDIFNHLDRFSNLTVNDSNFKAYIPMLSYKTVPCSFFLYLKDGSSYIYKYINVFINRNSNRMSFVHHNPLGGEEPIRYRFSWKILEKQESIFSNGENIKFYI